MPTHPRRWTAALACAGLLAAAACDGAGDHGVPAQEADEAERETAAPVTPMDSLAAGENVAEPGRSAEGAPAPPPALPPGSEPPAATEDTERVHPQGAQPIP